MRLSRGLCVILALCLLGLLYGSLGVYSPDGWVRGTTVITVRVTGMPTGVEGTDAEWQVSISISLPNFHHWLKPRMGTAEGPKELPVRAESWAAEWPGSNGFRNPLRWLRKRTGTAEGLKEPPVSAESRASEWPGNIGFCSLLRWLRERVTIFNKDAEQPSTGTDCMASVLPSCLGQLWEDLAQVDRIWLLCTSCRILCVLFMAWITLLLWRSVKRPQGQLSYRDQCHRKRWHWVKKGATPAEVCRACDLKTKSSTGKKASVSLQQSSKSTSSSSGNQAEQDSSGSPEPLAISVCPRICHCQRSRQTASSSSMGTDGASSNGTLSDYKLLGQIEANYIQLLKHLRHVHRLRLKEHRQQFYKKKTCH